METLEEVLLKSKMLTFLDMRDNFKNFMFDIFGYKDSTIIDVPFLILEIENDNVINVGFSMNIKKWVIYKMDRKSEIRTYLNKDYKLEIRMFIKDLTNEGINYDNFREYKKLYEKELLR